MHDVRPFSEMNDSGILWLINRVVFHPRGFALALHTNDEGEVVGWSMIGDGSEPYAFTDKKDEEHFKNAKTTLKNLCLDVAERRWSSNYE